MPFSPQVALYPTPGPSWEIEPDVASEDAGFRPRRASADHDEGGTGPFGPGRRPARPPARHDTASASRR